MSSASDSPIEPLDPNKEIPRVGGWLNNTERMITMKPRQIHAALGLGGDPHTREIDPDAKAAMLFIVGGVSMGTEPLDPSGQLAIVLDPGQAVSVIRNAMMGLLSAEGIEKVLKVMYQVGREEMEAKTAPALFAQAGLTGADEKIEADDFGDLLNRMLARMIETGRINLSDLDEDALSKEEREFLTIVDQNKEGDG